MSLGELYILYSIGKTTVEKKKKKKVIVASGRD